MAKFSSDVGQLMLDMQQIAEIPEDVIDEMLQAGSDAPVAAPDGARQDRAADEQHRCSA